MEKENLLNEEEKTSINATAGGGGGDLCGLQY